MKRLIWTLIFILTFNSIAWAGPIEFSGGVSDEFQYKELVFLSGEPVVFVGTVNVEEDEKNEEKKVTYSFSLTPEDLDIEGRLTRNVTLITTYTPVTDKGQTIANTTVTRYTENVSIGEDSFRLTNADIQFSQSAIIDNRPAIDFYSGNIQAVKRYEINGGEGTAQVKITGGDVGYKNFWGNTETQLLDYVYTVNRGSQGEADGDLSWEGTVSIKVSDSTTKSLQYSQNEANFTSFNGGYVQVINQGMISKYTYNLPRITDEGIDYLSRNQGTMSLQASKVPKIERLIVPKFRDTGGHWAQQDIEKLYSLGVFEGSSSFFIPDGYMSRVDFVKAVVKACDIGEDEEDSKTTRRSRRKKDEVEEVIFVDINSSHPDYKYVKKAFEKNIITRGKDYRFYPDEPLTKAEAMTILIRALGFEAKAPAPGYKTSYADDNKIPNWAKDAVYMATEAGIISGDNNNNINAHKQLKRSEASAILVRFLEFLEKDLKKDYSENIIYYY